VLVFDPGDLKETQRRDESVLRQELQVEGDERCPGKRGGNGRDVILLDDQRHSRECTC
jgi:hypothetical protein